MLSSGVSLEVSGPSTVAPGMSAQFTAIMQTVPGSHPSTGVTWSVSGTGCNAAPNQCGTISGTGLYAAPATPPQPSTVMVTATSVADPSKMASASAQIAGAAMLGILPANATVALEQTQQFSATLGGTPTTAVTWSVNGVAGGDTTLGTISNSSSLKGQYLAPVNMPAAREVTVTAASSTNPGQSASVTVQLTSNIAVTISPSSSVRVPGARQTFTVTVTQTSNPDVEWTVNGVANGNATYGQICLPGSTPCQPPPLSDVPGNMDYLAPPAVPSPAQVVVQAVSVADPAKFASASVTIAPQIAVNISPAGFTLPPGQVRAVMATVAGLADQNVTWDLDGSANGSIAGGLVCLPASHPC
jgi:hypothetical protein